MIDLGQLEKAAKALYEGLGRPSVKAGLILGSGWNDVVEAFDLDADISYADIPGLGKTGVAGHAGRAAVGTLGSVKTLIFQGRRHYYEGAGWTPVAIPVFALQQFGARSLLLTNAAGGMRNNLHPGDLMVLEDHINMMGGNPLIGPHQPTLGVRFPDQSTVYALRLRDMLYKAAKEADIDLSSGVYLASSGPSYETPAEVRAFRTMGGDAVGMSTVPEAVLANAAGMDVAGLSCITNYAAGISRQALSHEEVTEATTEAMPRMRKLIEAFWPMLGEAAG